MPIDYSKYPRNWLTEIRPRIMERDGHKCQRCSLPNYAAVNPGTRTVYSEHSTFKAASTWKAANSPGATIIVLTVAHLDHDIQNNADDNLAALCQKCHLKYDQDHHKKNAAKTRRMKRGTLTLFPEE